MHSHCINKLINIKDVIVKKVTYSDTSYNKKITE